MYSANLLLVTDFRVVDNVNMCVVKMNVELSVLMSSRNRWRHRCVVYIITCALVSEVLLIEK